MAVEGPLETLVAPYRKKLYDDRVAMLPADVQAVVRKPEKDRTVAEQKIADDYALELPPDWELELIFSDNLPAEAVKAYHSALAKLRIAAHRPLASDLQATN